MHLLQHLSLGLGVLALAYSSSSIVGRAFTSKPSSRITTKLSQTRDNLPLNSHTNNNDNMGDDQDQGEGEATQFTTNAHDLQEAAKLQARLSSKRNDQQRQQQQSQTTIESLHYQDAIQSVSLDEGAYKYVLITARLPNNNNNNSNNTKTRTFVYSKRNAEYHRNVAESLLPTLEQCGYTDIRIKGGGRILRDDKKRRVHIFGYSYGFGRADHAMAKKVVEGCDSFGGYEVTWSNDGY